MKKCLCVLLSLFLFNAVATHCDNVFQAVDFGSILVVLYLSFTHELFDPSRPPSPFINTADSNNDESLQELQEIIEDDEEEYTQDELKRIFIITKTSPIQIHKKPKSQE